MFDQAVIHNRLVVHTVSRAAFDGLREVHQRALRPQPVVWRQKVVGSNVMHHTSARKDSVSCSSHVGCEFDLSAHVACELDLLAPLLFFVESATMNFQCS